MKIRKYEIADTEQIVQLFYDTVQQVNIRDYTKAQVDAWAPADYLLKPVLQPNLSLKAIISRSLKSKK